MKIIIKNELHCFEELKVGDCFRCLDKYYMKIKSRLDNTAVELSSGQTTTFASYCCIEPVTINGVVIDD